MNGEAGPPRAGSYQTRPLSLLGPSSSRLEAALVELAEAIREEIRSELEPAAPGPERLLSIPEAAEALGIGRTLVYDLIASGRLRTVKVGRRRLVPASSIVQAAGR